MWSRNDCTANNRNSSHPTSKNKSKFHVTRVRLVIIISCFSIIMDDFVSRKVQKWCNSANQESNASWLNRHLVQCRMFECGHNPLAMPVDGNERIQWGGATIVCQAFSHGLAWNIAIWWCQHWATAAIVVCTQLFVPNENQVTAWRWLVHCASSFGECGVLVEPLILFSAFAEESLCCRFVYSVYACHSLSTSTSTPPLHSLFSSLLFLFFVRSIFRHRFNKCCCDWCWLAVAAADSCWLNWTTTFQSCRVKSIESAEGDECRVHHNVTKTATAAATQTEEKKMKRKVWHANDL